MLFQNLISSLSIVESISPPLKPTQALVTFFIFLDFLNWSAVMLVSTPNASGKTGYWENWIGDKQETTGMAYVASTRPKHLLCWALPKLTDEQRKQIEGLGFIKL